jgi:hypothetical protein
MTKDGLSCAEVLGFLMWSGLVVALVAAVPSAAALESISCLTSDSCLYQTHITRLIQPLPLAARAAVP